MRIRVGEVIVVVLGGAFAGLVAAMWSVDTPAAVAEPAIASAYEEPEVSARFTLCHSGGGKNCVVDGDTFWLSGAKIRIADIDAPETHPSRCPEEARLGEAATLRLQALLNAGPVRLEIGDRDTDRYGRQLRIVMRGDRSLGDMLVSEGLARHWTGRREPWC
jgi:micrococcal nuclease